MCTWNPGGTSVSTNLCPNSSCGAVAECCVPFEYSREEFCTVNYTTPYLATPHHFYINACKDDLHYIYSIDGGVPQDNCYHWPGGDVCTGSPDAGFECTYQPPYDDCTGRSGVVCVPNDLGVGHQLTLYLVDGGFCNEWIYYAITGACP